MEKIGSRLEPAPKWPFQGLQCLSPTVCVGIIFELPGLRIIISAFTGGGGGTVITRERLPLYFSLKSMWDCQMRLVEQQEIIH